VENGVQCKVLFSGPTDRKNKCRGLGCTASPELPTRNSSEDEMANVNFLYDYIVHYTYYTIQQTLA